MDNITTLRTSVYRAQPADTQPTDWVSYQLPLNTGERPERDQRYILEVSEQTAPADVLAYLLKQKEERRVLAGILFSATHTSQNALLRYMLSGYALQHGVLYFEGDSKGAFYLQEVAPHLKEYPIWHTIDANS